MNDRKIERSYGRCLGLQLLLANSMEISFHMKKKWLVAALNLQTIKTLLTLELSLPQAALPQATLLLPAATAAYSETPCICAGQSY